MHDTKKILPLSLVLPVLFVYIVISTLGLYFHELWLDEAQHFLIGRDSDSLAQLYYNMRYDGHPRLWNFLLYFVTHYITASYLGMQLLHLLITTSTLFIFLRYAPFNLLTKVLIISGYYFLFEYNVLSRNYALGILFLFICCVLLRNPRKNLLWIGGLLLLMCNTHLFFTFSAIGIFLYLFLEYAHQKQLFTNRWALFTLLFAAGVACSIIQSRTPPEGYPYLVRSDEWLSANSLFFAAGGFVKGWLPIPRIHEDRFWNTYWVDGVGRAGQALLFVFFLFLSYLILKNNRKAIVFYYSSISLLFAFSVVTHMTASRYFGMGYVFFLAACWMTGYQTEVVLSPANRSNYRGVRFFLRTSLYLVLSIQVITGVYALAQDFRRPFSQSKKAIDYLQRHQLADQEIAVDGYNAGPGLSAYLGKKVFYLDINQEGSYCYFRRSYFPIPRRPLAEELAQSALLQKLSTFILVSNRPLGPRPAESSLQYIPVAEFLNSIILSENYYIYQVRRGNL